GRVLGPGRLAGRNADLVRAGQEPEEGRPAPPHRFTTRKPKPGPNPSRIAIRLPPPAGRTPPKATPGTAKGAGDRSGDLSDRSPPPFAVCVSSRHPGWRLTILGLHQGIRSLPPFVVLRRLRPALVGLAGADQTQVGAEVRAAGAGAFARPAGVQAD